MNKYIKVVLTLFAFCTLFAKLYSQDKELIWHRADSLYSIADYESALKEYESLESAGYSSWQLYYNIGNCHFKKSGYGLSILYYERALRLNPSGKDILFNLDFARQFTIDKIDVVPEFVLNTWIRDVNYTLSSDIWASISLVFLGLTALLLLCFRYGPTSFSRKIAFFGAIVALLVVIVSTLFAWNQRNAFHKEDEAIVLSPVSTVRNSPDNSGSTLFILHEGTKVELVEGLGDWRRIELSDGRQGWIAAADIEII